MTHCTGWYFCTKSNWDNNIFDARNLVTIEKNSEDFNNLIDKKSLYPDDKFNCFRCYHELKPEVFEWLEQNIKNERENLKGWCSGNKEYNSNNEDFALFFYRRRDAIN